MSVNKHHAVSSTYLGRPAVDIGGGVIVHQ